MKIYIENKQLDITQGLESLLTFAIDDIKDFGARNTTFSKTIILPGTANNNSLFGNIFDARVSNPYASTSDNVSTNFNASVQAECFIFQNNIQIFKGTLRVLEIVIQGGFIEYECAVFGELGGLIATIGSNNLEDLDFSAYNHTFNYTNVVNSWDNVSGTGYYYPLIDYGTYSAVKHNWQLGTFRPALYVREYIDKIFTAAGYSWSCDLFNTARFKKLIVPFNRKDLTNFDTLLLDVYDSTPTNYNSTSNIAFNTLTELGLFTSSLSNTRFTYGGASPSLSGTITVSLTGEYYSDLQEVIFAVVINGTPISNYTLPDTGGLTPTPFTVDIILPGRSFSPSDYIEIQIYTNGIGTWNASVETANLKYVSDNPLPVPITNGDAVNLNETIPVNVRQIDFLSSVMKLFNLYLYEDNNTYRTVFIRPYVDFYNFNASGMVDWTYKVDRSKPISLKPMSELNSKIYDFNYKRDSDFYNELYSKRYNQGYGDYSFDSEYEFSNNNNKLEIIFSSTPLVGYSGEEKIYPTIFKKNAGVEERIDSNIRIMQTKKITGVASWNILDGASTLGSPTVYGYAGHYDDPDVPSNDLNFGALRELFFTLTTGDLSNTQFNVYWSSYMAEISDKDSKLMSCYVKLDSADIFNLNFSKPIYIDGSLWRLNKIEDWNANFPDVCKIELLKVINTVY
jgi:hypothetical protein